MKSLAQQFLSDQDMEKIIQTVREVELRTAGEIVPMVVSRSYSYPMADVIGAVVFALPISLILSHFIGGWLWIGHENMWLFSGVLTACFIAFHQICKHILWLKRLFISPREIDEEVEEAATTHFFREGLHRTREETGILIFISVFERKVWVLGAEGINKKVSKDQWDKIVHIITDGIRQKNQTEAICLAVKEAGQMLEKYFPIRQDDRDELKNLIMEDE
ncbi:MAG: TPM domain-containing protein [Desulfobacterales bacterium]|nr:TPM domain-containing protein [Desulfobacterales bacterium]MDD4072268.1 TPM domain-containing protein [Desulfobacterales bacterium]MDD4392805.1 TPM domain-containing protein [Desulfobacterales bacterium]